MIHPIRALACGVLLSLAASAPAVAASLADELIGNVVQDSRGWHVGRLTDLLIDPADDSIVFAVIDAGSRFEAPKRALALRLPDPKVSASQGALRVDMTVAQLRRLPSAASALEDLGQEQRSRLVSVSALLDASLRNAAREDIGDVEDAVVDIAKGKIAYVTADYDPSWRTPGRLVAIQKPRVAAADGEMSVQADEEQLRAAHDWDSGTAHIDKGSFWLRVRRTLGF